MNIRQRVTLAPYTTFGIGGPADFFVEVVSVEEIMEAVAFAKVKLLPFFLLGTGANILVGDKGFRGVVIKNEFRSVILNEVKDLDSSATPQNDKNVFLTVGSG